MMSITRRQALVGLASGIALSPFRVEAQSPAFGILVVAIEQTINQSATVIANVTEQLNRAVANGTALYDKIKLRQLRRTLESIEGQMVSLNANKIRNIEAFKDYLNNPSADNWQTIQGQCKVISLRLAELIGRLENDNTVLVKGTNLATAGDLKAALLQQSTIYLRLSTLGEPTTKEDRNKLRPVIDKLDELLKKVTALEMSIDDYLKKFASAP